MCKMYFTTTDDRRVTCNSNCAKIYRHLHIQTRKELIKKLKKEFT